MLHTGFERKSRTITECNRPTENWDGRIHNIHCWTAYTALLVRFAQGHAGINSKCSLRARVTKRVRFNVPINTLGHFGDESFQSVNCTGTDNLTRTTKRQNTQITQQNQSGLEITTKHSIKPTIKQRTDRHPRLVYSSFTTSGQAMNRVYSSNTGARTGQLTFNRSLIINIDLLDWPNITGNSLTE